MPRRQQAGHGCWLVAWQKLETFHVWQCPVVGTSSLCTHIPVRTVRVGRLLRSYCCIVSIQDATNQNRSVYCKVLYTVQVSLLTNPNGYR